MATRIGTDIRTIEVREDDNYRSGVIVRVSVPSGTVEVPLTNMEAADLIGAIASELSDIIRGS